jgi:hypothetical protein
MRETGFIQSLFSHKDQIQLESPEYFTVILLQATLNMQIKCVVNMTKSSTFKLLFVFSSIYFLFQYARYNLCRDPTTYFFDPTRAYSPGYTAQRREEASSFTKNRALLSFQRLSNDTAPKLCIGIASVARESVNHL